MISSWPGPHQRVWVGSGSAGWLDDVCKISRDLINENNAFVWVRSTKINLLHRHKLRWTADKGFSFNIRPMISICFISGSFPEQNLSGSEGHYEHHHVGGGVDSEGLGQHHTYPWNMRGRLNARWAIKTIHSSQGKAREPQMLYCAGSFVFIFLYKIYILFDAMVKYKFSTRIRGGKCGARVYLFSVGPWRNLKWTCVLLR